VKHVALVQMLVIRMTMVLVLVIRLVAQVVTILIALILVVLGQPHAEQPLVNLMNVVVVPHLLSQEQAHKYVRQGVPQLPV
jgi:hypothetical protein